MKKDVINLSIKLGVMFLVLTGVFTTTYYNNAELAKEILEPYFETLRELLSEDGSLSFVSIWLNNLFVCVRTVAMGTIPLVHLPIIILLSNAAIIGTVLGLSAAETNVALSDMILYMLLPHGVFELPALFLSFGLGIYLCQWMTKRMFRKNLDDSRNFIDVMNSIAKAFVLVVLPLVTVAAFVECYVTPEIAAWAGLA